MTPSPEFLRKEFKGDREPGINSLQPWLEPLKDYPEWKHLSEALYLPCDGIVVGAVGRFDVETEEDSGLRFKIAVPRVSGIDSSYESWHDLLTWLDFNRGKSDFRELQGLLKVFGISQHFYNVHRVDINTGGRENRIFWLPKENEALEESKIVAALALMNKRVWTGVFEGNIGYRDENEMATIAGDIVPNLLLSSDPFSSYITVSKIDKKELVEIGAKKSRSWPYTSQVAKISMNYLYPKEGLI